ncbi:hypothetical protein PV325_003358 [Microctonus aethiopoides]|nr:hypothetical protein PV325_003358 [Microctonus aethiopoides]
MDASYSPSTCCRSFVSLSGLRLNNDWPRPPSVGSRAKLYWNWIRNLAYKPRRDNRSPPVNRDLAGKLREAITVAAWKKQRGVAFVDRVSEQRRSDKVLGRRGRELMPKLAARSKVCRWQPPAALSDGLALPRPMISPRFV